MLRFAPTTQFRQDAKLMRTRGLDLAKLGQVIELLRSGASLPSRCRDHALSGRYAGMRECHIAPDWLLQYRVDADMLIAARTGSHADLFGM